MTVHTPSFHDNIAPGPPHYHSQLDFPNSSVHIREGRTSVERLQGCWHLKVTSSEQCVVRLTSQLTNSTPWLQEWWLIKVSRASSAPCA